MFFLLFVFVVTAVSQYWYKMRENIHHQLFRGEKIYFEEAKKHVVVKRLLSLRSPKTEPKLEDFYIGVC